MRNQKESTLFEAAFRIDNFTTRVDILMRKDDGRWHMIKVKSRINDKQKFIDDMAYTAMSVFALLALGKYGAGEAETQKQD
jgi:hypothetical protein